MRHAAHKHAGRPERPLRESSQLTGGHSVARGERIMSDVTAVNEISEFQARWISLTSFRILASMLLLRCPAKSSGVHKQCTRENAGCRIG
jgi:hypothetical protein